LTWHFRVSRGKVVGTGRSAARVTCPDIVESPALPDLSP
jgi:hypothetical protein